MIFFQCSDEFILIDDLDYRVSDEKLSRVLESAGTLYSVCLSGKIDYQERIIKDVDWELNPEFIEKGITSDNLKVSLSNLIIIPYILSANNNSDYFKIFFSSRKEALLELTKRSPESFDMPFEDEILMSPSEVGLYTYYYVDKNDIRNVKDIINN